MKIFYFALMLLFFGNIFSQTITIGTGSVLSEQDDRGNPILENNTDFLQFSQSVHVYNATQLASLPLYSTINSIGFKRFLTNTELFQPGRSATIKVYLKNSDRQTISNNKNFSEWIRGATLVYSNSNYSNADLPITQANVNFPCSGFQYMGNSIEVFVDARINGSPLFGYYEALRWYYDDTERFQANGLTSGFTRFDNSVIYEASQRSYQLNINYTPSVPCFNGNAPVQTLASTQVPCAGNRVRLSLSNYQTGYTYQWFIYTNNDLNPRLMENETNPTYNVPMLLNNQILNIYCRIACPQGAQFIFSEPVQITPTLIASFPYLETFDDDSPTADCWSQTADSRWFRDTKNFEDNKFPFASNKFIYRNEFLPKEITSPIINLTATSSTEFKQLVYRYATDDWFDVLISRNLEPFTVVYSHNSADNTVIDRSWATNTISLDNYDGERIRIQFRITSNTNATVNAMTAIDEVLIEVKPQPCAQAPKKPAAFYQGSGAFVFFSGLPNSTIVMEYGLTGFTPGTQGTAGIGGIAGLYSGSSANFTNLQTASNYDVYVRERCEVPGFPGTYTYSPNSTVATFSTCSRSSVPYFENFETSALPSLPDCTISVNESNGNNWAATNTPGFGFTSKAASYNYNFLGEANAWFFTNRINLEKDKRYVLRYRYGISDQGFIEKLKVAYGTIATGVGMTNLLKDHGSISIVGITNSSITFTSSINQGVYFGFNCYSDAQQDQLFVDDISVVEESYTLPVVETIQNFCSSPSPKVSDLVATGTNIKWYASLATTVVMPQSIALNNNQTYYVTQTIDGFESDRIAVKIFIRPRPTVIANQNVCAGKTLADLQVTGTNLKWYNASLGGTLLPATTVVSNTTYYVSQTVTGTGTCESTRATVNVTVSSPTIIAPTAVTACRNYQWSENGQTYNASGSYTFVNGNCEQKTLNLTINSTTWNGTTWSNDPPNATTKAIISGNYSLAIDLTACSLEITGTANVIVPSGFDFLITNEVNVASTANLTFENNANLLQTTNVVNNGNITSKRDSNALMLFDYSLWSSPVSGQELQSFSTATLASRFYTYDPITNTYKIEAATNNFSTGTGYLIRMPNNHPTTPTLWNGSFKGIPNNGNITLTVANNSYNAIGNPYPSTINANDFITANSLNEALYFWRKTNNAAFTSYATYTLAGGVANAGGLSSIVPNGTIQVGQGFIAKSTSTSFVFTNAIRTTNKLNQFLKTKAVERHRIWLNLSKDTTPVNQIMIAYMNGASAGIDGGLDGRFLNDSPVALNSIINNEEFVIQARGLPFQDNDSVPLTFKTSIDGNYSIGIDQVDGLFLRKQSVFLKDNLLRIMHNLKNSNYSFASASGTFDNRFMLVYRNSETLGTNEAEINSDAIVVYKQNRALTVDAGKTIIKTVRIFDLRGRLLFEQNNVNKNIFKLRDIGASKQVLLVQITTNENQVVTKKVVY